MSTTTMKNPEQVFAMIEIQENLNKLTEQADTLRKVLLVLDSIKEDPYDLLNDDLDIHRAAAVLSVLKTDFYDGKEELYATLKKTADLAHAWSTWTR